MIGLEPTFGKDEDPLISAGQDGLAELGDLGVAHLDLVHFLNIPTSHAQFLDALKNEAV